MKPQTVNDALVIRPQGQLDAHSGLTLQLQIVMGLLRYPQLCVIDMTHVEFIDCSGLRLLTAVLKATCEQHCSLVLCNLQPAVRMVLEISQLDKMFDIRREQPETVLAKSPRATAVGLTELAVS